MQIIELNHICKKGFGAYRSPYEELDELVKAGLLTSSIGGPFGETVYRPTDKGYQFNNSISR